MSRVDFCKIRAVKSPSRATKSDAGVDWYVPKWSEQFEKDLKEKNLDRGVRYDTVQPFSIWLDPHKRVLIPSGLKVKMRLNFLEKLVYKLFNLGVALISDNKSGVSTKKGLIVGACIVDYGYQGEVHLSVINTSDVPVEIRCGEKLVQFLEHPIVLSNYREISKEDFSKIKKSERGEGGFGSSGTK